MNRTQIFMKKHSTTILTIIGSTGVIITSILAVKATPKAMQLIEDEENRKKEELTKLEIIKVAWKPYLPAIISCASTILCIIGSNYLNIKKEKNLMSAYILLENMYKNYRNKVAETYGEDADKNIRHQVIEEQYNNQDVSLIEGENEVLFFEFNSLRFFETDIHKVLQAECKVLTQFEKYGYVSLNDYYSYLGLDPSPYGECMGWSRFQMRTEEYTDKLEFTYERVEMTNGLICYNIITNVHPTMDYFCF